MSRDYAVSIPPGTDRDVVAVAELVSAATATALLILHLHHEPRANAKTRDAAECLLAGAYAVAECYGPTGESCDRDAQVETMVEWNRARDDAYTFANESWNRSTLWRACTSYVHPSVNNLLGRFHRLRHPDPLTGRYEPDPTPVDHYVGLVETVVGGRVFDVVGPRAVALARANLRDGDAPTSFAALGRLAVDKLQVARGRRTYIFADAHAAPMRLAFELGYQLDAEGRLDEGGRVLRLAYKMRDAGVPISPATDWPENARVAAAIACDCVGDGNLDGARELFAEAAAILDPAKTQ